MYRIGFPFLLMMIIFTNCNTYEITQADINHIQLKKNETYIYNATGRIVKIYLLITPVDASDFNVETLTLKPEEGSIIKDISHIQIASLYNKQSNFEILRIVKHKYYQLYVNKKRKCYDLKLINP